MKRKDEGKGDKALGSGKDEGKGDKALGDMVLDSMKRSRLDTGSDPKASCSFRRCVPRAAPTDQDDGRQGRHGDDHASACAPVHIRPPPVWTPPAFIPPTPKGPPPGGPAAAGPGGLSLQAQEVWRQAILTVQQAQQAVLVSAKQFQELRAQEAVVRVQDPRPLAQPVWTPAAPRYCLAVSFVQSRNRSLATAVDASTGALGTGPAVDDASAGEPSSGEPSTGQQDPEQQPCDSQGCQLPCTTARTAMASGIYYATATTESDVDASSGEPSQTPTCSATLSYPPPVHCGPPSTPPPAHLWRARPSTKSTTPSESEPPVRCGPPSMPPPEHLERAQPSTTPSESKPPVRCGPRPPSMPPLEHLERAQPSTTPSESEPPVRWGPRLSSTPPELPRLLLERSQPSTTLSDEEDIMKARLRAIAEQNLREMERAKQCDDDII